MYRPRSKRSRSPQLSETRSAAPGESLSRRSARARHLRSEDFVNEHTHAPIGFQQEHGYSMIELLVSLVVLMIISGTVMDGVLRLTKTNQTVANRSEMHAGVRNVTALLQQEVGQAGRITLPAGLTIAGTIDSSNYTASSTVGMYVGEQLVIDTGTSEETVEITAINTATNRITGTFFNPHNAGSPISVY